jgi:hypothetical protein
MLSKRMNKKHTFKTKSKRVNRKSNKVHRRQRGGWPGDEKKLIKRQFLKNAILLGLMSKYTRNWSEWENFSSLMGPINSGPFMEKSGTIPERTSLEGLQRRWDRYNEQLKILDMKTQENVDRGMEPVHGLISLGSRDTNEQLREILRKIYDEVTSMKIAPISRHAVISESNHISKAFNHIISIGETYLFLKKTNIRLKTEFNNLIHFFFTNNDGVLVYNNKQTDTYHSNIDNEKLKLEGFIYYSGIEDEINVDSIEARDKYKSNLIDYINELNQQIN